MHYDISSSLFMWVGVSSASMVWLQHISGTKWYSFNRNCLPKILLTPECSQVKTVDFEGYNLIILPLFAGSDCVTECNWDKAEHGGSQEEGDKQGAVGEWPGRLFLPCDPSFLYPAPTITWAAPLHNPNPMLYCLIWDRGTNSAMYTLWPPQPWTRNHSPPLRMYFGHGMHKVTRTQISDKM